MSTLHTLNKTSQDIELNSKLSQTINSGDCVLLIENGVYQCLTLSLTSLTNQETSCWTHQAKSIYAIKDDALARGINTEIDGISFISYEEFVQLSLDSDKVVSWY